MFCPKSNTVELHIRITLDGKRTGYAENPTN
jgi:hypothetical protein